MTTTKIAKLIYTSMAIVFLLCAGFVSAATNCRDNPVDPAGNAGKLRDAIQQASNTATPVRITGTYTIHSPITVYIRKDLSVDASGAKFIASADLDGDMFSIDAHNTQSDICGYTGSANITWKGGEFNVSAAKVSKVVPQAEKTPVSRRGNANTADALSIRSVATNGNQKVNRVTVDGVNVIGTSSSTAEFSDAGGDSGVFISGAVQGTVQNSKFHGIRDAAIYVSSAENNASYGNDYTMTNNTIERAYDGITSKRGADNIVMRDNNLRNVVVGMSTKMVKEGRTAINIEMSGNVIRKAVRAILLEQANDATIDNNQIYEIGAVVAGQSNAINPNGNKYEAITFQGVRGSNECKNNTLSAVGGSRQNTTTTHGIVSRKFNGRSNSGIVKSNNRFTNFDRNDVNISSAASQFK